MISDAQLRRALPESVVSLCGDLIRWLLWALVFVVWAAFAQVYVRMIRLTISDPSHSDFTIFYYTARLVRDGLPMYGISPSRYGVAWAADHLGNLNPPHLQLLAMPLGFLTYPQALALWIAMSLVCLVASIAVIARELQVALSFRTVAIAGAFTLSSAAFTTVAVTCEISFVLMLPMTLAWRAWRRGHWTSCGAWLGVCASGKLFLLLFLPWLALRRQWSALAAAIASVAALVFVGAGIFGIEAYRQWLDTLTRIGWWWLTMNASWHGLVSRLFEGGTNLAPLARWPDVVRLAALLGAGLVTLATLAGAWRLASSGSETSRAPSGDRTFLLIFLGALLGSPLGWVYYLPLVYGPVVAIVRDHLQSVSRETWRPTLLLAIGLALLYVPHESTMRGQPSGLATLTIASAYFWGVFAVWAAQATSRSR